MNSAKIEHYTYALFYLWKEIFTLVILLIQLPVIVRIFTLSPSALGITISIFSDLKNGLINKYIFPSFRGGWKDTVTKHSITQHKRHIEGYQGSFSAASTPHPPQISQWVLTRKTIGYWNWGKWGLKEYIWKSSFLGWFIGLVMLVQEIFFCPALVALVSVQYMFTLTVHYITLFVPIAHQAGQTVMSLRLSFHICLWFWHMLQICSSFHWNAFNGGGGDLYSNGLSVPPALPVEPYCLTWKGLFRCKFLAILSAAAASAAAGMLHNEYFVPSSHIPDGVVTPAFSLVWLVLG